MSEGKEQLWERIHREATIIDLHAHPSLKAYTLKRRLTLNNKASSYFNPLSVRTDLPKLKYGQIDVFNSTVYAPEKDLLEDFRLLRLLKALRLIRKGVLSDTYFDTTISMLDQINTVVENSKDPETGKPWGRVAQSLEELEDILSLDDRPLIVIHNVEGAHSLDGNLDNLDALFQRGVAYMTLAHFYPNAVVHPVFPFPEYAKTLGGFRRGRDLTLGLTEFGRQVVERMIEIGMLIDIAHCTPRARKEIYEIVEDSDKRPPVIASHIGVFEINPNPYNLKDREIEWIASTGGVIGVIFMNYWLTPHDRKQGMDYIVETIRHIAEVGGIETVALGSDFDGFTDPPDDIKDMSELKVLTQRLVAEDFTYEHITKILGGNVLRVLRQGWGR
jgi:microsomal dipeptidase-like Zn-dependent dipeptidase